jgi:uncharacterized protein YjbI with pentapeptide repeats
MSRANLIESRLDGADLSGTIMKEAYLHEMEKAILWNRGIIDLEKVRVISG